MIPGYFGDIFGCFLHDLTAYTYPVNQQILTPLGVDLLVTIKKISIIIRKVLTGRIWYDSMGTAKEPHKK